MSRCVKHTAKTEQWAIYIRISQKIDNCTVIILRKTKDIIHYFQAVYIRVALYQMCSVFSADT